MATARIDTSKLPIQCPVCLETYVRPRTLPCLHTFCSTCLQGHITNALNHGGFSTFLCPVCRADTKPNRPFAPRHTWAEEFPLNHWVTTLIDETSSALKKEDVIYCDKHTDTKLNLFCTDHVIVCCAICVATEHRRCEQVEEIDKLVETCNVKLMKKEVLDQLKQSEDMLTDLDAKCALAESNLQIDKDKMKSDIESEYNSLIEHLDGLKQKAFDDVESRVKDIRSEIQTRKLICSKGKRICSDVKDIIGQINNNQSMPSSFIQIHRAKSFIRKFDMSSANKWTFNEANALKFTKNKALAVIKLADKFGQVTDTRHLPLPSSSSTTRHFSQNSGNDAILSASNGSLVVDNNAIKQSHELTKSVNRNMCQNPYRNSNQPQVLSEHPARHATKCRLDSYSKLSRYQLWNGESFKESWISGMTFLTHGLFLGCCQTEKALYLSKESIILFKEKSTTPPWDVAKLSETSIVVTYPQENKLRIFDIRYSGFVLKFFRRPSITGRPVSLFRSIDIREACFGVVVANDQIVLACEDCIKVYRLSGRCTQVFTSPVFKRVIGIAYDSQRSVLYATDEDTNALFGFPMSENQLRHQHTFEFRDPLLLRPQSLTIGPKGNIYVAGFVSKTIHIVSQEGRCICVLSTDFRPCGIAFDDRTNLLAISIYPEQDPHSNQTGDVLFYQIQEE